MLLVQSLNSVKFQQLAIFICHLLIGGQFQTVQIFYNSETLDPHLFREIQSKCLSEISWTTIDISRAGIPEWNQTVKSDHFIQLIFADGDVSQLSSSFEQPSNYYRLFVFQSNDAVSTAPKLSNRTKINSKSNSVSLFHNATGEITAHLLHDNLTIFQNAINLQNLNEPIKSAQVFDKVFGEREKIRKLGVFDANMYCGRPFFIKTLPDLYAQTIRKYFFKQMKMDFYEMGSTHCPLENGRYFRPVTRRIYEELEWDIEPIDVNEIQGTELLFENDSNIFFVNEFSKNNQNSTMSNITALSTVSTSKVRLGFVYEKSHQPMAPLNVWVFFGAIWIQIGFICCGTIMLYFLRRGDLMRRVELISTFIDVMTAVTGGGNLRYHNKLEKIFFGFVLLGAFYINAIGIENFLFATFLTQAPERIDTFSKLAKYNSPVFQINLSNDSVILQNIRGKLGFDVKIGNWNAAVGFSLYSYVLIADEFFMSLLEDYTNIFNYGFDIFPDSYGEIRRHYYLSYNGFVPKNLTKRFERVAQSLVENGLEQFYWTNSRFRGLINFRFAMNEYEDTKILRMEQFFFFLTFYAIFIVIAVVVFVIELIVHRMNKTN